MPGGESDGQGVNRRLFIKGIKWVSWASKNSRASSSKSRIQQQNLKKKKKKKVRHKTKQDKTREQTHKSEEKRTGKRPSVSQRHPVESIIHYRLHQVRHLPAPTLYAPSLALSHISLSHGYIEPIPLLTLAGLPATMTCEGWDCNEN